MLDKSDDKITAAVRNVFSDARFSRIKNAIYGFRGEIDGIKVGVVVATKSQRFASSTDFVLNRSDIQKLITALDACRLDEGYAVTAATDETGTLVFVDAIEVRKLVAEILAKQTPRSGRLGEFFIVAAHFTSSDNDEF